MKTCKIENVVPTFAKVKLTIKSGKKKIQKIARITMNTELQHKYHEKRKLKREIIQLSMKLKAQVGPVLFNGVIYSLDKSIKQKSITVTKRHEKRLIKLRKDKRSAFGENIKYICHTVHNFSSYQLSFNEEEALSFGLDEYIPSVCNHNKLFTEFEMFYQNILKDISHLNNDVITRLKTKLRHTCNKYSRIKVSYKYCNVINNLCRNKQLIILKQDKGTGVVLLDKTKYVEKCFSIINTNKFNKLDKNPRVSYEAKIQHTLRKMKLRFTLQEYNKVYPTGSNAGKLYGTAKIYKLPESETVDQLPLCPIVLNNGYRIILSCEALSQNFSPFKQK